MTILVSLNGVDLEWGRDYYWIPEDGIRPPGRLVLKKQAPLPQPRTFWENFLLAVTFKWSSIGAPHPPHIDFVSIENWLEGFRDSYFFGTEEFDKFVSYHEDLNYASTETSNQGSV